MRRRKGDPMRFQSMSRCARLSALASVVALASAIVMGLWFAWVTYWPRPANTQADRVDQVKPDSSAHAKQKRTEEIDRRFSLGAALLNAKQYDAAARELHRVLELAPQMPEAHANMGFAMIGLQRYDLARDFFDGAIALRRDQLNAYFGLAVALEGLHDLPGALGAMRTYVHLSNADDPYVRKANAAIWEWEQEMEKAGSDGGHPP